jgi:aminoglycoside 6'-N-acetyltransferase
VAAEIDDSTMTLRGDRVTLRPLAERHLAALAEILQESEASRWWGDYDAERLRGDYLTGGADDHAFAVELEDEPIGLVAYWEENEPFYRHAGMDIVIAADHRGQGLAGDALRALARYLFSERGHWRLTIDPAVDNERAIRSYLAIGFRAVGVLRRYERLPDGSFRDGLLMDLLPEELG